MAKTYFIADLHFGDEGIIRYENRPFTDAADMEKCLINNWNTAVLPEDTVYVLGDFSCNEEEKDGELLRKLNGTKILVMGNHDNHRKPQQWRELGFAECSQWPIIWKEFFILSHEPMYINENMPYANVYGHIHNNPSYKDVSKQSACVCVERIDYKPISFESLVVQMKALV